MTADALSSSVAALMRKVAAEVVMPRYRNLAQHEVIEKAADELVTIADRESEERLSEGLDPNGFHFMRYVRCLDTGVECMGYGEVTICVKVIKRAELA